MTNREEELLTELNVLKQKYHNAFQVVLMCRRCFGNGGSDFDEVYNTIVALDAVIKQQEEETC